MVLAELDDSTVYEYLGLNIPSRRSQRLRRRRSASTSSSGEAYPWISSSTYTWVFTHAPQRKFAEASEVFAQSVAGRSLDGTAATRQGPSGSG